MIAPKEAPRFDENELFGHGALLVAEVVSPSSRDYDRRAKARDYARAGIPLYLIVDPFAEQHVLTLLSDPDGRVYRSREEVATGKALWLPEPFGLWLETDKLLD
jgi:Uma2 family endonuclease